MLRVLASPMLGFVESPGLSLSVGHLGCRGWRPYLSEIFSAWGPD